MGFEEFYYPDFQEIKTQKQGDEEQMREGAAVWVLRHVTVGREG